MTLPIWKCVLPLSAQFDDTCDVFRMRLCNPVDAESLAVSYRLIFEHPKFTENTPALWDLTELDLGKVPLTEVRKLPAVLGELVRDRGDNYKAAIVTNRVMDYQLLRMYLSILRLIGRNIQFRLFRDLTEAEKWLTT